MKLVQKNIILKPKERGVHLVTQEIVTQLPEIREFKTALLHLFLQHTSAALTINENADPDVRTDTETFIDDLVPDGYPKFRHILEGYDDMPAHIKSMLFGCQLTIPITDGTLALGTWQGIYLIEARDHAGNRRVVATLQGNMV
ncbi:secondary thiamine-phosphate synthase enzyme YjbQ [Hydrogenimonas thermophila]|uniref:secondary thiamine-phosphate synthase enzyme YjbQ n=1 Tax=Hydrogenimonas thermophila TaxID=223786 RepID=UPI002936F1B8|nr:secondary thiamine-phosphate synthase enzyme YjbQ [Hydrogenimonas thermophila]WOE69796.1 secondary thiamine-phosphate synthase enzyme YjbQ [Hydrogenimonas thermophila]WOE72311.1 secondary thiamine-phosphate synthase enzyme YjbQ [Hydrogenimonas thermophila]